MARLGCALALALGPALSAQGTIVYPLANATVEGKTYNTVPFTGGTLRMQACLRESKGRAHAVKALTLRRDGSLTATGSARTVDLELKVGRGDFATFGGTFAANWVVPPSRAIARKNVNLPDWSQKPAQPPAAFSAKLAFDVAYAHSGQSELQWEVLVYANNKTDLYPEDSDGEGTFTYSNDTDLGAGCTTNTSGPGKSYTLQASFRSNGPDSFLDLGTFWAPASAFVDVMVGLADPNLAVPGLCARLRTDNRLRVQVGRADAGGSLLPRVFSVGAWQGAWANAKLYLQAVSLDATQPLPVALSQGVQVALPASVPSAPTTQQIVFNQSLTSATGFVLPGGPVVQVDT